MDIVSRCLKNDMNLDKVCFEMAVKGELGCKLVQGEGLKAEVRNFWRDTLFEAGWDDAATCVVAPGQPSYLRLMMGLLSYAGDPDWKFLEQGETGFPVGLISPMPRTPHMYEEQIAWKLENDPCMQEEVWQGNSESVAAHEEYVREHFQQECEEGLMEMTLEEANQRFHNRVVISSLAVLVEDDHSGKKRIIHDATHGTKVNHRIRCRDKTRSPGAREKQYLLAYYRDRRKVVMSLVGDISKAHRRFLREPAFWRHLVWLAPHTGGVV